MYQKEVFNKEEIEKLIRLGIQTASTHFIQDTKGVEMNLDYGIISEHCDVDVCQIELQPDGSANIVTTSDGMDDYGENISEYLAKVPKPEFPRPALRD